MSYLRSVLKRHGLRYLLSLLIIVLLVLHATGQKRFQFISELELKAYDIRVELTLPNTPDPRIVIVDIDEKSLAKVGHWPWPRAVTAQLIDELFDTYQIDTLGIDIVFAEPDESSGLKILERLAQGPLQKNVDFINILDRIRHQLDFDNLLVQSFKNRQVVLGYIFIGENTQIVKTGLLPEPAFAQSRVEEAKLTYITANGFVANLPNFQKNVASSGHFNPFVDPDGIIRRIPMLYGYEGALYESLSLATARLALGNPEIELGIIKQGDYQSLEFLRLGDRTIYVDDYIRTFVPYRGQYPSFPYVSAVDILAGQVKDPNLLKNKIVLIGTTAQGLLDLRPTPIASIFPGVEIHANMIAGILDSKTMRSPKYVTTIEVLLLIVIGLMMTLVLPLLEPLLAMLGAVLMFSLVFLINVKLWNDMHLVLPLAPTFLLMGTLLLINMSYGFFVEASKKRQLTSLFGQYVPPELVNEMSQQLGSRFTMEGQSREMTVLFSDVRGFTTISEGLESKELAELMNAFLTPMTEVIHRHRGTIDKYMGDAIMAFWGAPLNDPQHAYYAVEASMRMVERLAEIQPRFQKRGWPSVQIGIGLNTGVMNVGNMGSRFRMAYTVMGDAVNLGSRLEGLTKQYGVQIIVSERTKIAVGEAYCFRELDQVKVKGKDKPVAIFEPIGKQEQINESTSAELAYYQDALDAYRAQEWLTAKVAFEKLHARRPQFLYEVYLQRIAHFEIEPPPKNWDGVFTFTVK